MPRLEPCHRLLGDVGQGPGCWQGPKRVAAEGLRWGREPRHPKTCPTQSPHSEEWERGRLHRWRFQGPSHAHVVVPCFSHSQQRENVEKNCKKMQTSLVQ